ncbi:MAG: hypothetical protein ABI912_12600, partial [Actinomycetota bacterium]
MMFGGGHAVRTRMLTSQAFLLGIMITWIQVPSSAIFLSAYGSRLLPVTYVGAAVIGAAATTMMVRAMRRRSLVSIAVGLLPVIACALAAAWAALWRLELDEVAFALLVIVPILVPMGFVFLVGQAGALYDVRELKRLYPRVIAGFAAGAIVGGLAAPLLLSLFGRTEHLLLAGAVAALLLLLTVRLTRHRFSSELSVVQSSEPGERPTLRSLLSNRFVVLIMGFQMLSAVESQWLDFLMWNRAARRYPDTHALATFASRVMSIEYGSNILFLLLLAGFLLRRFGLRYGLTANAGIVLALIAVMLGTGAALGSGATVVFVLIVAT